MSIDSLEQRWGYGLSVLGGLFSLYLLYQVFFIGATSTTTTSKPTKGVCPTNSTLAHHLCKSVVVTTLSDLWLEFALVGLVTAVFALFVWRRRRTGTVFSSLFLGLATGVFGVGLPFFCYGIWVLWRAWRLQRYGVATFSGVSQIVRGEAQARKEGRTPPPRPVAAVSETKPSKASDAASTTYTPPEASKRYTPKKRVAKKKS
jgi:hypothetical protein